MKAWIVEWDWIGDYVKVENPLITIISSRRSSKYVSDFVEHFYLMSTCTAGELASLPCSCIKKW